ncbi:MAG TPA: hypothetical protein VFG30_00455 [Polyangiales bacterium]|nr:hypothetical protein [Polyangiales bacterium]
MTQDQPIICIPSALTHKQRARARELRARLAGATSNVREESDGYAYAYAYAADPELLRMLGEWIGLERLCCPFLTFEVRWPSGDDAPTLRLSGPEGVKDFLRAEMPELASQI